MSRAADIEDPGRELAQWLAEAGHRVAPQAKRGPQIEPADARLRYLEEVAGRPLLTCADIEAYFAELQRSGREAEAALRRRRLWREALLVTLAACAFLQYHFWDVYLAIERLPRLVVIAPAPPAEK